MKRYKSIIIIWSLVLFGFLCIALFPEYSFSFESAISPGKKVERIISGTNLTITPAGGKGVVTINASVSDSVITIYDEGVVQGNATTVNITGPNATATASGSTITINITGGNIVDTNYYPYDLIVGTPGALGVQAIVGSTQSFDAILASVSARGLTFNTTVQASIFFKNGVYPIFNSTVPAGITCYFDSTAVFKFNGGVTNQMINIYGKMVSPNIDGSSIAFTSTLVQLGSAAILTEPNFYGMAGQGDFVTGSAILGIGNDGAFVNNARVTKARFRDAKAQTGLSALGGSAPIRIINSSNTYIELMSYTADPGSDVSETHVAILSSTKTYFTGRMYNMRGQGIVVANGSVNTWLDNFEMHYTGTLGSTACISIGDDSGYRSGISTGTLITNAKLYFEGGGSGGGNIVLGVTGGSAINTRGLVISNFHAISTISGNSITMIDLDAGAYNTIILGSSSTGLNQAIVDNGVGTVKTGLYKDGVAQ